MREEIRLLGRDVDASEEAYRRHRDSGRMQTHAEQVFDVVNRHPAGCTAPAIYRALNAANIYYKNDEVEVRRRLTDLANRGAVTKGRAVTLINPVAGRPDPTSHLWFPASGKQLSLL